MTKPLTKTQQAVLDYLKSRIAENGVSPTSREISHALGLAHVNSGWQYMQALNAKGYIELARGIKIVGANTGPDPKAMEDALRFFVWLFEEEGRPTLVERCEKALKVGP